MISFGQKPSAKVTSMESRMYTKGTVVSLSTVIAFFLIQTQSLSDASLTANYDIKRCYKVDITFHYHINGGLTSNTTKKTQSDFSYIFKTVSNLLQRLPQCSGVIITNEDITASPPGVNSIFFRVPVVFTASNNVPDDQVSSKLTDCINAAKSYYKGYLDTNTPKITEGDVTYTKFNLSTISDKRSCCGGDVPPPCCAAGSVNVSSTKCGCLLGFKFVPSSFCVRCPPDTYQDEQGQNVCKMCPGKKQTFGKTGMTSQSNCTDASLIANYDIKRCYEVDITFHYHINGGLTSNTTKKTQSDFANIAQTVSNLLQMVPKCSGVNITNEDITASPPGVSSIFFRVPVVFTASNNVPDDQVSSKLTDCINTMKSSYKGFIDRFAPTITEGDVTHTVSNLSTISDKRSCCGGDIPPPCCAAGSINVSSTKCGCLPGFKFVPSSFCVRCPPDTYQDKQGQNVCKTCPVKKQTFGKTGMTSQSNCSDTNPLQLRDLAAYLPYDVTPGTVVTNVTVTGNLAALVQPFIFYIETVTQRQQSGSSLKRRRRDIDDVCEEAGTIEPLNYFCIHRMSGQIEVTQNFAFKSGEKFNLKIRVTDSDHWGKTENSANVKLISSDNCKEIRVIYNDAVKFCIKSSPGNELSSCPTVQCLESLYNWREAVNSSKKLNGDCSDDPHNMAAVMQKPSCNI